MTTASIPLASTQFRQMLRLLLPKEHGSWSLVLEPLGLGLIAAPSRAGVALGIAVLAGFFARRPLKIAISKLEPRRALAWSCLASLGVLAAMGMTVAAALATPAHLEPLLLAVPPGLAFVWFESRGEARAAAAELAGAFACSVIPAAMASVAGWRTEASLTLAAVMVGRAVPTVMTIRAYLRRRKGQTAEVATALTASLAAVAVVGALAQAHMATWTAVWFMALLVVRAIGLLGPFHFQFGATRLGVTEALWGGVGVILVALSWPR
jgi:YwiC-like protein